MIILILGVLFGLGFTFLATQNAALVTVRIGVYAWAVPLYLVALGSLLVGLLIAWLFSLVDWASSAVMLYGKEHQIERAQEAVGALEKKLREVEMENAKLREEKIEIKAREHAIHTKEDGPSIFEKLRHRFSISG